MKELSIEEKAKRYDEAIKKVEVLYKVSEPMSGCNVIIETLFPELKESEDERIRESIIAIINNYVDNSNTFKPKMIAWLEKQVLVDEDEIVKGIRRGVAISLMNYIDANSKGMCLSNMECEDIENAIVNEDWDKVYGYMKKKLEKQGEQKPAANVELKFKVKYAGSEYNVFEVKDIAGVTFYGIEDEPNHIDYVKAENCEIISGYGIKEIGLSFPTKPVMFSEQKSADKTEPKFKVGDWVVYKNDICQIVKREEGCNKLVTVFGIEKELVNERNLSTAHLWTIQDAKDGDVLCGYPGADYPWIGIFHKLNTEGTFNSHCFLQAGQHGKFCPPSGENIFGKRNVDNHASENVVPATKEQRDLLFQKMKEAGYEWDAENKELKKENKL